ncbi:MAG: hypothetical protein LBD82_08635 [Deltaproteobacteria bacterium]|nr:hypothetical protein [Deltaproteobacteria bacterium]
MRRALSLVLFTLSLMPSVPGGVWAASGTADMTLPDVRANLSSLFEQAEAFCARPGSLPFMSAQGCARALAQVRRNLTQRLPNLNRMRQCVSYADSLIQNRDEALKTHNDWCVERFGNLHDRKGCRDAAEFIYENLSEDGLCHNYTLPYPLKSSPPEQVQTALARTAAPLTPPVVTRASLKPQETEQKFDQPKIGRRPSAAPPPHALTTPGVSTTGKSPSSYSKPKAVPGSGARRPLPNAPSVKPPAAAPPKGQTGRPDETTKTPPGLAPLPSNQENSLNAPAGAMWPPPFTPPPPSISLRSQQGEAPPPLLPQTAKPGNSPFGTNQAVPPAPGTATPNTPAPGQHAPAAASTPAAANLKQPPANTVPAPAPTPAPGTAPAEEKARALPPVPPLGRTIPPVVPQFPSEYQDQGKNPAAEAAEAALGGNLTPKTETMDSFSGVIPNFAPPPPPPPPGNAAAEITPLPMPAGQAGK